ncbi:MAG: helix-turn-helix transcriptional regulator [Sulfuriferula sp.]
MQSQTVLRLAAVILKTNLSKSTIYRLEAEGNFPKRVRLGANSTGWHADEIDAWLVNRPRVADAPKAA